LIQLVYFCLVFGGAWFESWMGHLTTLTIVFCDFTKPFQVSAGIGGLDCNNFLPVLAVSLKHPVTSQQ